MLSRTGFTLSEVLIALAVILIVSAASWPLIGNWSLTARLNGEQADLTQNLRLVQAQAAAGWQHNSYGVKFLPQAYILFKGLSYAERESASDIVVTLGKGLALTWQLNGGGQADEIVFAADGHPSRFGQITIAAGDAVANINLSRSGYWQ